MKNLNRLLFAGAFVLLAAPSQAQSFTVPSALYVASGQMDAWSTVPIKPGQRELNPFGAWLYDKGGTPAFVAGTLAADTATAYLVTHTIGLHHPHAALVTLYALTALRMAFAARNIHLNRTYEPPSGLGPALFTQPPDQRVRRLTR